MKTYYVEFPARETDRGLKETLLPSLKPFFSDLDLLPRRSQL